MTAIDKSRKERLRACEKALAEHMEEFVKVGMALKEIRDARLWDVEGYKNFEDYCRKKWDISKSHASNVISSSELRLSLPSFPRENSVEPAVVSAETEWTEKAVREIKRLKSTSKAKAVAQRVVKEVKEAKDRGEKVKLGSVVRKHVNQELGTDRKPSPPERPDFSEVIFGWTGQLKGMASEIEGVPEDALLLLGKNDPGLVKGFAEAIERLSKAWCVTKPAPAPRRRTLEM